MKQFNLTTKSVKSLFLLLALLLGGTSPTWADELTVYDGTGTSQYIPVYGYYVDSSGSSEFIIPSSDLSALNGQSIEQMVFYLSSPAEASWGSASFNVYLEEVTGSNYDDASSSQLTDSKTLVYAGALDGTGTTMEITFTTNYTYNGGNLLIAIEVGTKGSYYSASFYGKTTTSYASRYKYGNSSASRAKFIPKTTFVTPTSGPGFTVKDGSNKLTSPYDYSFGLATAGTTHTFTLSNPGTAAVEGLSVSATGTDFTPTLSATSIAAGGEATLTITMPATSGSSAITISSTTDGIDDFVINASGTVRDPNKVYEYGFTALPDDWTTSGTWYYSEANGAYTTVWYLSNNARLITPKLTIAEGEKFYVEAKGYSTSNTSYQHLQMQYSADGTTWTNFGSEPALDPSNWNTYEFTGAPAGSYYIAINASQADIRMFYGGEIPNEPKMVVTQPASLDFGVMYPADTQTKTFTIANTGKAALEGITVAMSGELEYAFHLSNAPTTLAAGASQEVTITMGPQAPVTTLNSGHYSTEITVSATGFTGDDAVKFTVEGYVISNNMSKEEFTDGLPANWTNASWTFANGIATGKSSSAYLTTPKLKFSEGDFIILKARRYDSDTSDYLTVQGSSDNGSTWTAYSKKLQNADGLTYPDFGTIVLSDIPTTVNKLRFVGYYAEIDEIMGLNYAPVLSVTTGEPATAVSTPANYDFGECAADATVTYNFANAGAGTINITNVAITGDGAAAYSTNWTESVAAPFDLTITRTYAERTTAQAAAVTVTTSEGDFVINVTGTDKAANAPELAVSTNAIDFGKVTADAVETVTVTNNGTGSMAVNIYSNSEDFTVSPASLTGIGAGESKTFDITFKYGTPYGVKKGNVTVTPTYDENAKQTITVTGNAKDPNVWSEDFSGNTLPTGWSMDNNWTIEDGVSKGSYSYSGSYYLTTPTLTVSAATDELTFDYAATSNYVSIKIQMSKDGAAFTDLHTISGLNSGDADSYTITGLEAGDYQFRFKNDDYNLDNFEGFVLNLPDHMATITASSIPESSSYSVTMKEGQSFDATVTVKELRGVAENLTAKLYMGEEVIGTKAGSVAANGTETLTITCTPTVAATEGAQMHIEVEWAGTKMTTETVTRYVAAITNLTLDETSSDAVVAGTYDNVTLKRKFNAGWNTVCLPFTISDVEGFFGAGAKAYNFSSYNSTSGELGFTAVTELTASYPYVVYVPSAISDDIELHNITIAPGDATAFYRYQSGAYFRGTYAPVAAGAWTKNADSDIIYGVTSDGHIKKAGSSASIKGFRAYFDLPAGANAPSISFEDTTTGITNLTPALSEGEGAVYNLNGQKVQNAQKGLYIVNGKKVVIK